MGKSGRRNRVTENVKATKKGRSRPPRHPSMPNWNAIRADVVAGISTRVAAKKHDVSYSTLAKRAAREGWEHARKQIGSEVAAATDAQIAKDHVMDAIAAARDGDRVAGKIEQLVESTVDSLGQKIANPDATKTEKISLEKIAFALDALARSHGKAHGTRRLALRMDEAGGRSGQGSLLDSVLDEM